MTVHFLFCTRIYFLNACTIFFFSFDDKDFIIIAIIIQHSIFFIIFKVVNIFVRIKSSK